MNKKNRNRSRCNSQNRTHQGAPLMMAADIQILPDDHVTIPREDYDILLIKAARIEIGRKYVESESGVYVDRNLIAAILGVEDKHE